MLFWKFIRACRKYKFTFVLGTYGELEILLRPNNTFQNIKITEKYGNYKQLFKKAIREMKNYNSLYR